MGGRILITDLRCCWVLIVCFLFVGSISAQEIMIKDYFGHTAKDKETVFSICQDYHVTYDELMDYNPDMKKPTFKLKNGYYVKIPDFAKRGLRYYKGLGYEINYEKAVECFKRAAEQGCENDEIYFYLGLCYNNGRGVTQDYAQAVSWYRKAADQGNSTAQKNLGYCYRFGHGVAQDYAQAVSWFSKAADQGNSAAQHNLGYCYEYGQGVVQDYAQAVSWYRKAADQGNASAQNNLGWMYYKGIYLQQDYQKAYEWFTKAADKGDNYAVGNLGMMYYNGQYVKKDSQKAFDLLKKASESDNPPSDAMRVLSACYRYGVGTTVDNEKAEYWLKKSAEKGDEQSKKILENE